MVDGYTAQQIRAAEAPHLAAGEPLMQRAAAALAAEISAVLGPIRHERPARVLLLAGSGDNGGDGLFAVAALAERGTRVTVVPTGARLHEAGLAAALLAGATVSDAAHLVTLAAEADVVVDAIVGTGTSADPALRGAARDAVAAVLPIVAAPGGPTVVAVDIPSGIDPDNGGVPDPTVLPADLTVTFGGCKAGLLLPPASRLAGTVRVIDIGLGPELARVTPAVQTAG